MRGAAARKAGAELSAETGGGSGQGLLESALTQWLKMDGIDRFYGDEMGRGMEQGRIDAEKFGNFIAALRRENHLTQKQLAEKLYVSNKAVSKWERGLSLPDIALLEPLADAFDVTVTELLHGERKKENTAENVSTDTVKTYWMEKLEENAEENRRILQQAKKKRALYYCLGAVVALAEMGLLYLQGHRVGITAEQISIDVLLSVCLPLFFGIWLFFFIREKLPSYYDTEKISVYSDGIFRMNLAGVYFSNSNWPYILKAGRGFCLLTPVLYPALYFILRLAVPLEIWRWMSLYVQLTIVLGGLFIPIVIVGKKYERK